MKILSLNIRGFGIGSGENKLSWAKELLFKEKPIFVAFQETKLNLVNRQWVQRLWGNNNCDFLQKEKIGKSGGQLLIWDTSYFAATNAIVFDRVIGIRGIWKSSGDELNVLNVYGPHDDSRKKLLWETLSKTINDDLWVLCGDFNEVRYPEERLNCDFIVNRASMFNNFIEANKLIDIPLGGRCFTRVSDDGVKFSKLDRYLVSEIFLNSWGDISVVALERKHSDHCPIILKSEEKNFGPKPFKFFDAWLDNKEVDQVVLEA
ncbi:uncharacterized protein [Rutidosis leptorrhynchoides]|uniref:uncharacterized protein n=1 Tax=Rutidosis leptorrhynchoides TaxID=125765 RepID=UPI003A9A27A5